MIQLLSESRDIVEALEKVAPKRIAVAYVGIDWKEFISTENLKEIVVSPTLGSNPISISEIVKEIGWKNVHFLNSLHSKIYIGDDSVIVGSANLSKNAMGDDGLYESCLLTNEEKIVDSSKELFKFYRTKAQDKYDKTQKINRLEKLREIHNNAVSHGIIKSDNSRSFSEYSPDLHGDFYVIWYIDGPVQYNTKKIKSTLPSVPSEDFDFNDFPRQNISPHDNIKADNWILNWKMTKSNSVNKATNPWWMYIHCICLDCCNDDGYENVAIESPYIQKPNPPFVIDDDFKNAFIDTIERKKYDIFRDTQGDLWLAKNTKHLFQDFINDIKKSIA